MAGEVRLPNSCPAYFFLRVLLHMDGNCHGAKIVCHDDWRTVAAFFQCLFHQLFHQLLFIANNCDRFTQFLATRGMLCLLDRTKYSITF